MHSFDRRYEEMEAKLRAKHDEELENLKQKQKAYAKFSATVDRLWDDFNAGERPRLLEEKQKVLDEGAQLRAKMVINEQRCVYFLDSVENKKK